MTTIPSIPIFRARAATAAAAAALLLATSAGAGERLELATESWRVDGVRAVEIEIPWGTLQVIGEDRRDVELVSNVEGLDDVVASARQGALDGRVWWTQEEAEGVLRLASVAAESVGFHGVHAQLRVPRKLATVLVVRRGGEISARDLDGAVDVRNWNGSVELRNLGGPALVHADNGSIDVDFRRADGSLPMSFSSMNGSVVVTLPDGVNATLWGRYAKGEFSSEFGGLEAPRRTPLGKASGSSRQQLIDSAPFLVTGQLGAGSRDGARWSFYSANGSIELKRRSL